MAVHLKPETESLLNELSVESGRPPDELAEDAIAAYAARLAEVRNLVERRYADIKSGRVTPIDGEAFFEGLKRREDELLARNPRDDR